MWEGKSKLHKNECAAFACACASELENCLLAAIQASHAVMKYPGLSRHMTPVWVVLDSPYLS